MSRRIEYKGRVFRSELAARWAVYLDLLHVAYEYLPGPVRLSDGTAYQPDFRLPGFHCYLAVCGRQDEDTVYGMETVRKISNGRDSGSWAGMVCFGGPWEQGSLTIYCQETDDEGGGSYEGKVEFRCLKESGAACLLAYGDRRERRFYDSFGEEMERIPMFTKGDVAYEWGDIVPACISAAELARAAGFENGAAAITRRWS